MDWTLTKARPTRPVFCQLAVRRINLFSCCSLLNSEEQQLNMQIIAVGLLEQEKAWCDRQDKTTTKYIGRLQWDRFAVFRNQIISETCRRLIQHSKERKQKSASTRLRIENEWTDKSLCYPVRTTIAVQWLVYGNRSYRVYQKLVTAFDCPHLYKFETSFRDFVTHQRRFFLNSIYLYCNQQSSTTWKTTVWFLLIKIK